MLQSMKKNGLRLSVFALGCTAAIVFTHVGTNDQIATQQQEKLAATLNQMLPNGSFTNELTSDCHMFSDPLLGDSNPHQIYIAKNDDSISGYIVDSIAPDGYSGKIHLLTGITSDGSVHRVEVLEHHETPGLGDKIDRDKSSWLDSFAHKNKSAAWAVKKDGGEFDSFTGATITPRAIVKQIKNVVTLIDTQSEAINQSALCEEK